MAFSRGGCFKKDQRESFIADPRGWGGGGAFASSKATLGKKKSLRRSREYIIAGQSAPLLPLSVRARGTIVSVTFLRMMAPGYVVLPGVYTHIVCNGVDAPYSTILYSLRWPLNCRAYVYSSSSLIFQRPILLVTKNKERKKKTHI